MIDPIIKPITNPNEESNPEFKANFHGSVYHSGRPTDSVVQDIVNYAYRLGGYDFVAVFECENGTYDLTRLGDNGHAHGLCQINDYFHKDIPANYETDWVTAVEYCYQKRRDGVAFYGPTRPIKGTKTPCYEYVKDRFTFLE